MCSVFFIHPIMPYAYGAALGPISDRDATARTSRNVRKTAPVNPVAVTVNAGLTPWSQMPRSGRISKASQIPSGVYAT
jgi:hypothetical protein